jgi:Uma2 family endonuclease
MTTTVLRDSGNAEPSASAPLVSTLHEHLLFVEGSLDDFYAIEEQKADYIEGIIVMHSPASLPHEEIFGDIYTDLRQFVKSRKLGTVLGSRSLVAFSDTHRFEPDIMFIASTNSGVWTQGEREFRGVPDLVVEILSTSTRRYDLDVKRTLYQHYGVAEIVFIDQREREIVIDQHDDDTNAYTTTVLRGGESAEGSENSEGSASCESLVLAEFRWRFDELFS